MKITLVDNASLWYRMHSQRALIVIAAIQGFITAMPPDVQAMPLVGGYTLLQVATSCTVATAALGFIGRLLTQPSVTPGA